MNSESMHTTFRDTLLLLGAASLMSVGLANAQVPVDEYGAPITTMDSGDGDIANNGSEDLLLSAADLETLVGPVALYPDDLLAIVLPASTYPLEIVQAARFLEQLEIDSSLTPNEQWDESVVALLNYPEVVNLMNDDLDWTWKLGEAVIAQQNDLVAAVESFRDRAYAAGNLKTDKYQTVSNDEGIIEIEPVSDDTIYVPYYEPASVVVYQPSPVYNYYPRPYPVYYYPYAPGHQFRSGFFWGVTTAFTIGWESDYLRVYHPSYYGHPYYGRTYSNNYYWRRPSLHRYNDYYVSNQRRRSHDNYRRGDYWRPRYRGGARPGHQATRNSYYSGSQRSNTRQYRDGRTDGLAYKGGNFKSSRSTGQRSSRHAPGARNVSANTSTPRPEVQFRRRNGNTFVGSKAPRLERNSGSSHAQATRRSTATRRTTNSANNNTVRFRSRNSSSNRTPSRAANVRRQALRTETAAASTRDRRSSFASSRSTRTNHNSTRKTTAASPSRIRGSAASPSRVRGSAPTRVSSQQRQTTARQPRATNNTRSVKAPRRAQNSNVSRPSTRKSSPQRSKAPARSKRASAGGRKRGSGGRSRSSH